MYHEGANYKGKQPYYYWSPVVWGFVSELKHWKTAEIFFKVFKSGCQVERLQLKKAERLFPAFALYLIIAWRILYLTMLGRATPELSCAAVLEEAEWKAVWVVTQKQALPAQPPPLAQMIKLIAKLGGHKGRKGEGPPESKTMWEGLRRVFDLALAWNTFGPEVNHAYG